MNDLSEIEAAIERLPPQELAKLAAWIQERHADAWDRQIEADLDAGRLDRVLSEAEADYRAGLDTPLFGSR